MKLETLMNENYGKLNENDREICRYLLENRKKCSCASIDQIAARCHVSKTVLVRFAQKLTLPGFRELKAMLRLEEKNDRMNTEDLLGVVTSSYHKMLEDIGHKDCSRLFEKMYRARRILVYGSGYAQARVASEFKRIFLPVKKNVFHIHGNDMVEPMIHLAGEGDIAFIISLSGESERVIQLAEGLRLKKIPMVSVTHMYQNRLASLCEENLYIHSIQLPDEYGIDYEISTPYFILIELLFLKYQHWLREYQSF